MRSLNRVVLVMVILLAAAALASLLRSRGDRHRLGGATDLAGSLDALIADFNRLRNSPRLLLVLSPACPVCLEGAETVQTEVLSRRPDLQVLLVWMEAVPLDITRNPARRVEAFTHEPRILQYYDVLQVSGESLRDVLEWPAGSVPWSIFLYYPPGVAWGEETPAPAAWFHQREVADPACYRTGPDLGRDLLQVTPPPEN